MNIFAQARRTLGQPDPNFGAPLDTTHGTILYVEGVTVSFDGFRALNNLNLYIDEGELRCIIGPNGAGKTTMMDVITGKTKPDAGSVYFGQQINLNSPNIKSHAVGLAANFKSPLFLKP
jgi:urea transport system ATP-binding protein